MKIKALPKRLRELAEKYIKEQKWELDSGLFVADIVWRTTKEGNLFWKMVNEGEFGEARKIYDWDFMQETLPGSEGKAFSIVLDEDWNKNTTLGIFDETEWTWDISNNTYFWSCNPAQKLKNEWKPNKKSIEEVSPINSSTTETLNPLKPFKVVVKEWLEKSTHDEPQDKNDFKDITDSIAKLLEYKNKQYGNSALEPLEIFGGKCTYGSRVDEKLARVQNSEELRKNDIVDILGGLILICREKNWNNFDEYLVD